MKSRTWWALRDTWHHPHMYHWDQVNILRDLRTFCTLLHKPKTYRIIWGANKGNLKYDLRTTAYCLWNLLPFSCKGRGWSAQFCDYLERKARDEEIKEEPGRFEEEY